MPGFPRQIEDELEEVLKDHEISGSLDALTEGEGRFLLGASFKSVHDIDNAINKAIAGRQSLAAKMETRTGEAAAGSEPDVAGGTGEISGLGQGEGGSTAADQKTSDSAIPGYHYQTLTALFGEDALFSEAEADAPAIILLASPVNKNDLTAVFPNATITDLPDGYDIVIGKVSFSLRTVEQITPDTNAFAVGYGREPGEGEQIRGAVHNGEILIASIGDRGTIRHESYHLIEDLGLVTREEQQILNEAAAQALAENRLPGVSASFSPEEQRAHYMEQQLAKREFDRNTPTGKVLQKLADFVDSLANLALRTERGILRDLEAGKFFEREAQTPSPQATHYALDADAVVRIARKVHQDEPVRNRRGVEFVVDVNPDVPLETAEDPNRKMYAIFAEQVSGNTWERDSDHLRDAQGRPLTYTLAEARNTVISMGSCCRRHNCTAHFTGDPGKSCP